MLLNDLRSQGDGDHTGINACGVVRVADSASQLPGKIRNGGEIRLLRRNGITTDAMQNSEILADPALAPTILHKLAGSSKLGQVACPGRNNQGLCRVTRNFDQRVKIIVA